MSNALAHGSLSIVEHDFYGLNIRVGAVDVVNLKSRGDMPVARRKAVAKWLADENPASIAISAIERVE